MTGSVAGANVTKLRGFASLSVTQFPGCDPTGATSSLSAFSAAYSAAAVGQRIEIPVGTYLGVTGVLTGTKFVIWEADGTSVEGANGGWSLPGLVVMGIAGTPYGSSERTSRTITTPADGANTWVQRTTSHTGGASTQICAAALNYTIVNAGATNFEWTTLTILDNHATSGENVALFAQANKYNTGPTWSSVLSVTDWTGNADPLYGLVAVEIDLEANGTDSHGNRVGIDLVGVKHSSGASPQYGYGMRIGPKNGDAAQCTFTNGIHVFGNVTTGINIPANGTTGISISGAQSVGLDLSSGSFSLAAIRVPDGAAVSFNNTPSSLYHFSGPVTPGLVYSVGGTSQFILGDAGNFFMNNNFGFTGNVTVRSSATAGSASALPGAPAGYLPFTIGGTNYKLPYWNN